jgi:hypothetical protein
MVAGIPAQEAVDAVTCFARLHGEKQPGTLTIIAAQPVLTRAS